MLPLRELKFGAKYLYRECSDMDALSQETWLPALFQGGFQELELLLDVQTSSSQYRRQRIHCLLPVLNLCGILFGLVVLGVEPRTSHMLSECSTTERYFQPPFAFFF